MPIIDALMHMSSISPCILTAVATSPLTLGSGSGVSSATVLSSSENSQNLMSGADVQNSINSNKTFSSFEKRHGRPFDLPILKYAVVPKEFLSPSNRSSASETMNS